MSDTTKILSQVGIQIQAGSTFEDSSLTTLPYTGNKFRQVRETIEDSSFYGVAFKDLPQKGVYMVNGGVTANCELNSLAVLLEAAIGNHSAGVSAFAEGTANTKKLSLGRKDGVTYKQYANVYVKSLKLSSTPDNLFMVEPEFIGVTAEVRDSLANWPANVALADEAFTFHEMSGSGYFRVADQADALAAGDHIQINDFSIDIVTGFDEEHYNSYEILTPVFGQVRPEVNASFRISKHDADTFLSYRDNMTKLQASILIYKSATKQIQIDIPNFIIDTELTDDDLVKQEVTLKIGRNGVGTTYANSNFSFTSPVRFTLTSS